jgi:hypothetical protein
VLFCSLSMVGESLLLIGTHVVVVMLPGVPPVGVDEDGTDKKLEI